MSTNGVSLAAMNETMTQQFAVMMEEIARLKAEKTAESAKPTTLYVPPANGGAPAIAKVGATPFTAQVWKVGQPLKLSGTPSEKSTGTRKGKPCGSGPKSKGLCQKCNGLFNPVAHFSLDAILRLDGKLDPITHENWETSQFVGISVDGDYWGNVVFVGFGKDCLNMRPKTAVRLAKALGGDKSPAAVHIIAVLTANNSANLLA